MVRGPRMGDFESADAGFRKLDTPTWLKSYGVTLRALYRCQRCVRCQASRTRCSGVSSKSLAFPSCNAATAASVRSDEAIGRPSSSKVTRPPSNAASQSDESNRPLWTSNRFASVSQRAQLTAEALLLKKNGNLRAIVSLLHGADASDRLWTLHELVETSK